MLTSTTLNKINRNGHHLIVSVSKLIETFNAFIEEPTEQEGLLLEESTNEVKQTLDELLLLMSSSIAKMAGEESDIPIKKTDKGYKL